MKLKRALLLLAMGATAAVTAIAPGAQAVPPGEEGAYVACSADHLDQPTIGGYIVQTSPCYSYQTSFSVWKPGAECYAPHVTARVIHIRSENDFDVQWQGSFCATGGVHYSNVWPYNEYRYSDAWVPPGSYFEIYQWAR